MYSLHGMPTNDRYHISRIRGRIIKVSRKRHTALVHLSLDEISFTNLPSFSLFTHPHQFNQPCSIT